MRLADVTQQLAAQQPAGADFIRLVWCLGRHRGVYPLAVKEAERFALTAPRLLAAIRKGNVSGGDSSTWAGSLADFYSLMSEWVALAARRTVLGQLRANRAPFQTRVLTSADALDADFVAAGAAIPAQQPNLTDSATLTRTKIGVLAFATDELMQTWQPGTLSQLDNILQTAIRRGADRAVLDPDRTAISDERPASLLNGAAPLGSLNSDAAGALSDFEALIGAHIDAGSDLDRLLICLHPKTALRLCTMTNSNGDAAFPNLTPMGGSIFGVQVATTISAIRSGSPNEYVVAAIDGARVLLADDSEATLTVSKWATVEMSSTPTQSSTTPTPSEQVSMFQTDSVCIKLARTINFQACDSSAASWMTSTF